MTVPFHLSKVLVALILAACTSLPARAQLNIEITGGGTNQIPIAILPFASEAGLPQSVTQIVAADLERSGRFKVLPIGAGNPVPTEISHLRLDDLRNRGADAVLIGGVSPVSGGRFEVRFRLIDVLKREELGGLVFAAPGSQLRPLAHRMADYVYEKLTGDKGVFSTRIAYIVKQGARHELHVADADGFGATPILVSTEPIMSPTWSPDGTRLAYVSFQQKKPVVFVQDVMQGRQTVVANARGSNSAPAWSPRGDQMAVVMTLTGNSQIYLVNPDGTGSPRRVSNSTGIDTEPVFSPDGSMIYFSSDRGGSPQIYRMPSTGGNVQRVTFEGTYNVSPRLTADGKYMIYLSRNEGRYQITSLDLATRQTQILTDGSRDESPSAAPNGKMILYATDVGGRGVLSAISIDGRIKQRLSIEAADVREPAWGPFVK
jgi:TolB protein